MPEPVSVAEIFDDTQSIDARSSGQNAVRVALQLPVGAGGADTTSHLPSPVAAPPAEAELPPLSRSESINEAAPLLPATIQPARDPARDHSSSDSSSRKTAPPQPPQPNQASDSSNKARVVQQSEEPAVPGEEHIIERFELKSATVLDGARLIAEASGLDVVATTEAGETEVSLFLNRITARQAVEILSQVSGL